MSEKDGFRLEQIHLQITRNCNLRCYFCSQWGERGYFSDAAGREMTMREWEKVIDEIDDLRKKTGISPFVMVWGGEPLVSPHFGRLATLLHEKGFVVGIVTNGVLMNRFSDIINVSVSRLFLSLDGPRELHDSIRGPGVFDRVAENLTKLNGPEITVMSVVTNELAGQIRPFLDSLTEINRQGGRISRVILQDMIGLNEAEIRDYKKEMSGRFGISADFIDSWENSGKLFFHDEVNEALDEFKRDGQKVGIRSDYVPEVICKHHNEGTNEYCLSPFRHAHINWNGEVSYCTDFYDFSAGNVREQSLEEIFINEKSEKFRRMIEEGRCSACRHCSWRDKRQFV